MNRLDTIIGLLSIFALGILLAVAMYCNDQEIRARLELSEAALARCGEHVNQLSRECGR